MSGFRALFAHSGNYDYVRVSMCFTVETTKRIKIKFSIGIYSVSFLVNLIAHRFGKIEDYFARSNL
jgi:hypothetical protein